MITSRLVAVLLATCISLITLGFLSLIDAVPSSAYIIAGAISFAASYLLIYLTLEFFIFREVNNLYEVLRDLGTDSPGLGSENQRQHFNPLRQISEEINVYARFKQAQVEELQKMAEYRREFIADVSHELKTPLFAAQGYIHTLLDGAINDKSVRQRFLKKAAKSLDGLDMLVHDLLSLSQIESGEVHIHPEAIEMDEVVMEVFDQFENKAQKKKIKLGLSADSDAVVYADVKLIYQVMVNLISNAIKYTKDDGVVDVYYEYTKEEVTIYVKDKGRGIPKEDLARIFERFYRVEKSRSKEKDKGGTGLGLAIVKHILELHDSSIEVESEVGKGSTFSFTLKKAALPIETEGLVS